MLGTKTRRQSFAEPEDRKDGWRTSRQAGRQADESVLGDKGGHAKYRYDKIRGMLVKDGDLERKRRAIITAETANQ